MRCVVVIVFVSLVAADPSAVAAGPGGDAATAGLTAAAQWASVGCLLVALCGLALLSRRSG